MSSWVWSQEWLELELLHRHNTSLKPKLTMSASENSKSSSSQTGPLWILMRAELCHRSQQCFRLLSELLHTALYGLIIEMFVSRAGQINKWASVFSQVSYFYVTMTTRTQCIFLKYISTEEAAEWDVSQRNYYERLSRMLTKVTYSWKLTTNTDDSSGTKQIIVQSNAL